MKKNQKRIAAAVAATLTAATAATVLVTQISTTTASPLGAFLWPTAKPPVSCAPPTKCPPTTAATKTAPQPTLSEYVTTGDSKAANNCIAIVGSAYDKKLGCVVSGAIELSQDETFAKASKVPVALVTFGNMVIPQPGQAGTWYYRASVQTNQGKVFVGQTKKFYIEGPTTKPAPSTKPAPTTQKSTTSASTKPSVAPTAPTAKTTTAPKRSDAVATGDSKVLGNTVAIVGSAYKASVGFVVSGGIELSQDEAFAKASKVPVALVSFGNLLLPKLGSGTWYYRAYVQTNLGQIFVGETKKLYIEGATTSTKPTETRPTTAATKPTQIKPTEGTKPTETKPTEATKPTTETQGSEKPSEKTTIVVPTTGQQMHVVVVAD